MNVVVSLILKILLVYSLFMMSAHIKTKTLVNQTLQTNNLKFKNYIRRILLK